MSRPAPVPAIASAPPVAAAASTPAAVASMSAMPASEIQRIDTVVPAAAPPRRSATRNDERKVPLEIHYPKALFAGTPKRITMPNLEVATTRPVVLMVPVGTILLSRGKAVTSSDSLPIIGELSFVTDGDKTGTDGTYVELGPNPQWIQIDLGRAALIHAVAVWHFHSQARVYHDVIVQVSDDKTFGTAVTTIFNNDDNNSSRLGTGRDPAYIESHRGRLIDGRGTPGRYVRLYSNGNTSDELNHYCEVEVFGQPHP